MLPSVGHLSNHELLARVKSLAQGEREATAALIAHLAELGERRLYLAEGCSSLFTYCTQVLHLSEHAAYGRIQAARVVRRFPVILEMLEDGSLNLTSVGLLATHLTQDNYRELLDMARHKSKRQVEELLALLHPQPPVASAVRRLPTAPHTAAAPPPPDDVTASLLTDDGQHATADLPPPAPTPPRARPAVVTPMAPQRYKVQFTASAETVEKLQLAQALLRHQIPDGDPAAIIDRALTALLENLTKQKLAATDRPRGSSGTAPRSRHIPAAVRRAVWLRDGGRCAFVSRQGRRCTEGSFLEFHHVAPYAAGGGPTVDNIQLRCRAHNGYEAELYFGPRQPERVREGQACYLIPGSNGAGGRGRGSARQLGPDRVGEQLLSSRGGRAG